MGVGQPQSLLNVPQASSITIDPVAGEQSMLETMAGVVSTMFPRPAEAPADQRIASIIEVLQEHLALAREGRLRSVAVIAVSADGSAIGTQWSCTHGDIASLIGKLAVLTHDMMAARK
jgi:hypothetical protein